MTTYQSQSTRVRQLFSTLAAVTVSNPVLLEGEKWSEKSATTGRFTGRTKTGDGVVAGTAPNQTITGTAFNDLPFDPAPGGGVSSVTLTPPAGWSSSSGNAGGSITLTLGLPAGFSLPSNASQALWDTAYSDRLRWDGGSTGLNAATGRASLQLGSAAATDASAYATAAQGGKADTAVQPAALTSGLASKADLIGGLVPTSQIPSVAIVEYLGQAANQAAMLALRGQGGDWCIRTDSSTEWVIVANNGATLSDWIQLPNGISLVSSINGQTGAVTLGTGDLGESGGNLFFTAARAIGSALTGFVAGAGTVAATDSILQAINKIVGNIAAKTQVSSSAPQPLAAVAAAGSSDDAARIDHVHQRDTDLLVVNLSGSGSDPTAANTIETFTFTFPAQILASALSSETAASAAAFQANARLNANSIYSVRPQIAIGSTTGSAGTLAITSAAIGDVLRFDISQAGGGCRLAKLYLTIRRTA
jgi:hypothetical protein